MDAHKRGGAKSWSRKDRKRLRKVARKALKTALKKGAD
jgi:hypothetical protein